MSEITLEKLAGDIAQRMDGLGEELRAAVSDEKLKAMIEEMLPQVLKDQTVVRNMRFGADRGETHNPLAGTKYGRLGMSVADVELLHDIMSAQKVIGGPGPSDELRTVFSKVSESRAVPSVQARAEDERAIERLLEAGALDQDGFARAKASIEQVYGAMDTQESGYGSELIGNQYVAELWRGAREQSRIFALIRQFDMTHPTAFLPTEADLPEMLFVAESTGSSATNYGTSKTGSNRVQVDAKKFVIHQIWSGEMEEDSIIPFLPFLREEAARSLAFHSDSLVLNGDTTNAATGNINLDDADPADTKHYLAFDGIRHAGLVDNTNNRADAAGAITYAKLTAQRGRMLDTTYKHDWGHPIDPNDLVYAADPETVDQIGLLDEVLTVDKLGERATVLNGQQARIGQHPLISSIAISKTEADGKVSTTASNNTKGQVATFNRRGFVTGVRRQLKVESERIIGTDQSRIVYSLRLGFGRFSPTGSASGIEAADVLYNVSL